jgi:hypothetical protein
VTWNTFESSGIHDKLWKAGLAGATAANAGVFLEQFRLLRVCPTKIRVSTVYQKRRRLASKKTQIIVGNLEQGIHNFFHRAS